MRILVSFVIFLVGCGLIAYSYVGAFITLASEIERDIYGPTPLSAIAKILSYINSGEIPQLAGFLYGGLLLIAFSIVHLFRQRKTNGDA